MEDNLKCGILHHGSSMERNTGAKAADTNGLNLNILNTITFLFLIFFSQYMNSGKISKENMKKFGVVYTPTSIIDYILSGIDFFLNSTFIHNLEPNFSSNALINPNVYYQDPAAGNGEFPIRLIENSASDLMKLTKSDADGLFSRLYCFEILEKHFNSLKDGLNTLRNDRLDQKNNTLNIFNINTLANPKQNPLPAVKSKKLLVIFGNPPYSVSTANKGATITAMIEDYKDGIEPNGTKRITSVRALQDDYVKFIRYAQFTLIDRWKNPGMIAFVVNHYFLDGIIFRGMRKKLIEDFDEIYVLDLNGEMKKEIPQSVKEKGILKDENLFNIITGFCIVFMIKKNVNNPSSKSKLGKVYFNELYGLNQTKEEYLKQGFNPGDYELIEFDNQLCFKKREFDQKLETEYQNFVDINEIFKSSSQGIVTAHDSLVSDYDLDRLKQKISDFFKMDTESYNQNGVVYSKGRDWSPEKARQTTNKQNAISKIIRWAYRGFDRPFLCYDLPLINSSTHRYALMQYLLPSEDGINNYRAICTTRESYAYVWNSILMVDLPVDNGMISSSSGSRSYIFPLRTKQSNIESKWIDHLSERFNANVNEEDLFYYVYAILNCPEYRMRYNDMLKREFPKIPLDHCQTYQRFKSLSDLGKQMGDLHCFQIDQSIEKNYDISFPIECEMI